MTTHRLISLARWGLALVLFLAPLVIDPRLYDYAEIPKSAWLQVCCALLAVIWLAALSREERPVLHISPLLLPLVIFLLWGLASVSYATNTYEVMHRWLIWALAAIAFFLVSNLFRKRQDMERLLFAMYGAGVVVAIIGMAQHLFGLNLLPQAAAPSATFGNKNMAVHLLVLILPLGIALCLTQQRRLALLLPISLALVSTYLIYTQTRGGWLAVIIELVLFIIMIRRLQAQGRLSLGRQRKRGMAMGLILFLLLAGLGPGFSFQGYSLLGKRLAQTKEQATTTQGQVRLAYWANSLAMIREHPLLGTGLGNFKVHYPHYYNAVIDDWSFGNIRQTTTPHNDLIQLMVELGLGGLFLGIWLLGKMIYLGLRNGQRLPDERAIYAGALAIALVGCLINSQFSFPMQRTIPPFFAMICLALLSNILLVDRQIVVSPKRISIYALLALLCLVRLGPYQYGAWQANRLLMETILLTEAGQWQEAMDRGRQSWQSQPAKTRPILTYLGKAALRAGQPRAAEQCFTTLLADYPANINDLASLGTVYAVQGRNDEAMAMFEKSIAIYGENWGAYNNMGYMFMGRQLYGKAQKAFVQAASLRPGSAKLWHNVALAAEKTGDMEMARKAGQKIKELEEKGKTEP